MPERPRPFLTGPLRRRLAPWLFGATAIAVAVSWRVADRDQWIGPLFVLGGLAVGSQAVDGLRTGELHGRFPNKLPADAERTPSPFMFWSLFIMYSSMGLFFAGAGIVITVEWFRR